MNSNEIYQKQGLTNKIDKLSSYFTARCIKLPGETDSAMRRRKITGVTSPRGAEEAYCYELF